MYQRTKVFRCPFCDKKYVSVDGVGNHVEQEHEEMVPPMVTPRQVCFNYRNRLPLTQTHGKSILSGRPTPWNEEAGRYERLLNEKEKQEYRKIFMARMMKAYGKVNLLDDPEVQKKMLANRKISGVYKYGKDGVEFKYTGSYEKDFLVYMDDFGWDAKDLFMPAPFTLPYKSPRDGSKHFYIPDVYIESLKLVVEIKSAENMHYRKRDIDMEMAKDKAVQSAGIHFVKVCDRNYAELKATIEGLRK